MGIVLPRNPIMNRTTFTQILLFIALILFALMAGALLAYPAHLVLPEASFSHLAERGSLFCGFFASLLYARWNIPFSFAAIGYRQPPGGFWRTLTRAYGIGMLLMLGPVLVLWQLGLSEIDPARDFNTAFFIETLLKGLLAGIGAGLIEETLFRGALYGGLERRINVPWAILLSSLLFAAVHFIEYPEPIGSVHWHTGLVLFPAAMSKLFDPVILSHFLTLFLLGVLLCLLRWNDGHIWRAFGVHAGIVMVIKLNSYTTSRSSNEAFDFLVNPYNGRLGWLTAVWLLALVLLYYWHSRRRR